MTNITPELIEKAKTAKSAEELLELAKANGVEMTEEAAKSCFAQLNATGAISDDELDAVTGGGCFEFLFSVNVDEIAEVPNGRKCPYCGSKSGVTSYNSGEILLNLPGVNRSVFCTQCGKTFSNAAEKHKIKKL